MTETSFFWASTISGDASLAPYTNDEISDVMRQAFQFDRTYTLPTFFYQFLPEQWHYPFEIRLSQAQGSVVIEKGVALVDGKLYFLPATIAFDVHEEGYYRLVLRKTFPAIVDDTPIGQTVRATMLYAQTYDGLEPTRTDDEVWEVTIATILNDSGLLTFYPSTTSTVWDKSYEVSTASGEYGNRIMPEAAICIPARRGGSATNWGTAGDTKYVCEQSRIEVGSVTISANPQAHTFAEPFTYTPIVVLTPQDDDGASWVGNNLCISALSATGFSVRFDNITGLSRVQYMAIGPVF